MTAHTHPRIHPDWRSPAPTPAPTPAHPCWHTASPPAASASPPRAGEGPAKRSATSATAATESAESAEDAEDAESAELRAAPPPSSDGRMTQLDHTALPLRHRIYALYCEGRSFTAIARTLWLDRGTVARHVHAIEATLLAEQSATSLAALRLRAVAAQHAILAAAWDALRFEEHQEYDYERERDRDRAEDHHHTPQPGRSRRAQLLATAARAARTAAQLQGLFTPAALQAALTAALRDALPLETAPGAPAEHPAAAGAAAATCGMPASAPAPHAASAPRTGLPIELNSTDAPSTTSPATPALPAGLQLADGPPITPPVASRLSRACNVRDGSLTTLTRTAAGPEERSAPSHLSCGAGPRAPIAYNAARDATHRKHLLM